MKNECICFKSPICCVLLKQHHMFDLINNWNDINPMSTSDLYKMKVCLF